MSSSLFAIACLLNARGDEAQLAWNTASSRSARSAGLMDDVIRSTNRNVELRRREGAPNILHGSGEEMDILKCEIPDELSQALEARLWATGESASGFNTLVRRALNKPVHTLFQVSTPLICGLPDKSPRGSEKSLQEGMRCPGAKSQSVSSQFRPSREGRCRQQATKS